MCKIEHKELSIIAHPAVQLVGELEVPGDKSISHRALMLGAIAEGITEISGFLESEDCLATLNILSQLGVLIEKIGPSQFIVHGAGAQGLRAPKHALDCGNSGTTMRLMAGILAAQAFNSQLIGDSSLLQRPMARIAEPLQLMGAKLSTTPQGTAPLNIQGQAALRGIRYTMTKASAQLKSGVLLAGLYAEGETTVIEPLPTRDHTELMLEAFAYPITRNAGSVSLMGKHYCRGTAIQVPGDISAAAFFMVAACLIPGANLKINNIGINPTRTGIIEILQQMGANISLENRRRYGNEWVADICVKQAQLSGIEIPEKIIPSAIDEFPIIFIAAAMAKGQTVLQGAGELRVKESDRIEAMASGLRSLGISLETFPDGIAIQGGQLQGGKVDSQGDHRIAMAFAIAGLVAKAPVEIAHCAAIATSFPGFVATANQLGLSLETAFCV